MEEPSIGPLEPWRTLLSAEASGANAVAGATFEAGGGGSEVR